MLGFGVPELLILFAIILLLFGVGRISKISGEIGSSIRAFREGLSGDREKEK
jgi:sec-independent protein translocase protein TatA